MEESNDDEIWRRMLDGDAHAFGPIWDRHRDRVFGKLLALGSTRTDAEDLTAVAFLELWRRRRSVRFVDGSLLPWLLVTAHNVWRNSARATRRYQALIARLPEPEHAPDPAERVDPLAEARARAVRRVLSEAREADRVLLGLTAIDGLTVREAATALGIGESAAKMRLSRLRRRLSSAVDPVPSLEGEPS
ncbi:RNA polymerase sigma factor [Streptomyces sp. AC495_CC817]|uniref:RNA polymerase sigma factor n=1 Tax=Streptomyces sp. AC495_CC817 TaxID=2823900 RepID=UPI001C253C42|nr:RNA polymerase sigma factor [Streptomyces sp. AC495_CC817]